MILGISVQNLEAMPTELSQSVNNLTINVSLFWIKEYY
jgi:hypothetical protein